MSVETLFDPDPIEPVDLGYRFVVYGTPAPQGSKRGFYNQKTKRVNIVEDSKRVRPWKEAVKEMALSARGLTEDDSLADPIAGPVVVSVRFYLPRPRSHFGTGRNAGTVKASAPTFPAVVPDLDKLVRSTLDALTEAGLIVDDKQIVGLNAIKRYPDMLMDSPGAVIVVEVLV